MASSSNIWVIIPAYNEEKTLGEVLKGLAGCGYHLVVVDDGSSDRTRATALEHPATVLSHATNLGQGAALQTGISYALRFPQVKALVTFDADGQHQAGDIERLVAAWKSGGYDVVLGSRFLAGGRAENISRAKRAALSLALWITRATTGLELTDTHNGLRLLSRRAAAQIQLTHNGMAHASELLAQVAALKLRYCEVPVSVTYTAYSVSKGQSVWNGINILWELLTSKIR